MSHNFTFFLLSHGQNFLIEKSLFSSVLFFIFSFGGAARSQIVPDGSLGAESAIVSSPMPGTTQIDGGARRGVNLFHSFSEFSIPIGREAFFNNDANVGNIINRVTGNRISNIDGTLRSNGTANLFLLNPNGIVFGPEARLNIGGSFFATTAESVRFAGGIEFGVGGIREPPLLSVNVPVGLQFGENPRSIRNRSQALRPVPLPPELPIPSDAGLEVAPGRTLALIGGDIFLENGNLTAVQGEVRLGSVAGPGIVTFSPMPTGLTLDYGAISTFGTIELSGMATIDVSGLGGGAISLRGNDIIVREDAGLVALTFGSSDGRGIEVTGDRFLLLEDALISTATFGTGSGGDLTIRTDESVEFSGPGFAPLQALAFSALVGTLDADDPEFGVNIGSQGNGRAGAIAIETGNFILREGSFLANPTDGSEAGGNAIVRADAIEIDAAFLFSIAGLGAMGNAGDIVLETQTLRLVDGGSIFTITLGSGSGSNVIVRATDLVEISGNPQEVLLGGVSSGSFFGNGPAGRIEIDARRIVIAEGGFITSASGTFLGTTAIVQGGPGNNVFLRASESIEVRGSAAGALFPSFVSTMSLGDAPAGDLRIETGSFVVRDGALVSSSGGELVDGSAGGTGDAGTLEIVADIVRLDGGGTLSASTASGLGGNISIQTEDLRLSGQSAIATDAGSSDGGNIAIAADTLVAFGNSDITANAQAGSGGQITIEAIGVFGTQFRNFPTSNSDITATSLLGADFSGTVAIDEPEVDPSSTFTALPENPINVAILFDRNPCHNFFYNGEFYAIGRGGIAPHPLGEAIPYAPSGDRLWIAANRETSNARSSPQISEAIDWKRDENGNVVALLGATAPQGDRCNES